LIFRVLHIGRYATVDNASHGFPRKI